MKSKIESLLVKHKYAYSNQIALNTNQKSKTGNFNPGQDYLPRPEAISLGRSVVIE